MSVKIGTPLSQTAKKVLLCGAGELGKEVAIELQRLGVEVIAVDRYANAPAMQIAHRRYRQRLAFDLEADHAPAALLAGEDGSFEDAVEARTAAIGLGVGEGGLVVFQTGILLQPTGVMPKWRRHG